MLIVLYSAVLAVALIVRTLVYLVPTMRGMSDREELRQRFGGVPAALLEVVTGKRVIWVHAVSVGEVLAASRLVAELGTALGEGWEVVISTTTRTGQALAKERFGATRVFYMPLDFAFAVRPFLRALKPAALVLMESEVWPRMMHECRRVGTPVVVVNARVSDRSFNRSLKVRWIWSRVLRRATLWLAQSEEDARRLVAMGARAEDVRVGGNLKFDVRAPKQSRVAELIKEAAAGRPVIVAGSTLGATKLEVAAEPDLGVEEDIILHAWQDLPQRDKTGILVVLAPRHPERFDFAETLIDTFYARATKLESLRGPAGFNLQYEVILLDTIGDLAAVYGIADVAFVGGSLVKRGGHNPLEPAQFGVPVVMGPSYENFRGVVDAMRAADGITVLGQTADSSAALRNGNQGLVEELQAELVRLLTDREAAKAMGERGRRVFEAQQGATARAVEAIVGLVKL